MNAPNRAAEVKAAFATLGLPIVAKTPTDEGRRENLFRIVKALNQRDNGAWGVLVKTDQGGKIPGDVIVWWPSMEHFDVILGAGGPGWLEHGVVPSDKWIWRKVDAEAPSAPPPPAGGTPGGETLDALGPDVRASLGRLEGQLAAVLAVLDAVSEQIPDSGTLTIPAATTKSRKATLTLTRRKGTFVGGSGG
jgi:hypothetical protein